MSARITFPAKTEINGQMTWADGLYHTDDSDIRWQYNAFKKRWSLAPLPALSQAFITDTDTPGVDSQHLLWIDPSDGTQSYWDAAADAWVVTSGAGTDGEDGEDLTSVAGIVTIATEEHTLVTANIDKYLRLTFDGSGRVVTIPAVDGSFAPVAGNLVTLRNTSASTNVTIAGSGITLNYATGANTLGPKATAQLMCVALNEWDIL